MPNYQTLFEISRLLAAETNIARLLPLAMDKIIEAAGAQRGMILVCGEDGELLFETARNRDKMDIAQPEFEISKTIIDPVLKNGEPVLLENAVDSESFGGSESIKKLRILSVVCVALKHEDSIIGAIYIDNRKVTALFNEDTLHLLTEFANLIAVVVKNALQHRQLLQRQQKLAAELAEEKGYGQIVGKSEAMARVLSLVDDIADSDATVLISGETGTGKELIARALHAKSSRKNHEFVALNCAALPENLLESELFGHEKGAFTGAHQRKAGWFEAANNGTLFLDEIAELPAPVQVKLLRFLQSGEYTPVGSTKTKTADVRLISATNCDLKKLIKEKAFREDLYYRLNTIELGLPPLRARYEDVIEIAEYFLLRDLAQFKKPGLRLSDEAGTFLRRYEFPGNVRELENMMQRAVLLARGDAIEIGHLIPTSQESPVARIPGERDFNSAKNALIESFECDFIRARLDETNGNITKAAQNAGMYKANFIQKMQKHGIKREDFIHR